MYQHHEATQPARSTACWALIVVGANKATMIIASSFAITSDAQEMGSHDPDDLGIVLKDVKPGFWLWQGMSNFDGLDDVSYEGDMTELRTIEEVWEWQSKHEEAPAVEFTRHTPPGGCLLGDITGEPQNNGDLSSTNYD